MEIPLLMCPTIYFETKSPKLIPMNSLYLTFQIQPPFQLVYYSEWGQWQLQSIPMQGQRGRCCTILCVPFLLRRLILGSSVQKGHQCERRDFRESSGISPNAQGFISEHRMINKATMPGTVDRMDEPNQTYYRTIVMIAG